jgi:hypothetical protein
VCWDNERAVTQEGNIQSFDEKAALAELERLRESIQLARQARQRTSDEFEAFVKSFRTPVPPTRIPEPPTATPPAPEALPQTPAESDSRPLQPPDAMPSTVAVPSTIDAPDARTAAPLAPLPRRYRVNLRLLGTLAVIAVIALVLVSTRSPRQQSPSTRANAVTPDAASIPNSGTPPAAASALAPPAATVPGVVLELRIVRPVWMRVVVDGHKDVEGMVQRGEPLHFTADHSIVVRVGNGGDVLVKTGNREESFGDAGQPRTRTFSKP